MKRAAIERQASALRAGQKSPESVIESVRPGFSTEPQLVRTRALEVAVEAVLASPDQAETVVRALRDAIEDGPPLTTREIELLAPIAEQSPRALADCVQPLLDVLGDAEDGSTSEQFLDSTGTDRRRIAAGAVLVDAVAGAPGLFQGAVATIVDLAGVESDPERQSLWLLARLSDAEPATIRPTVAGLVWTLEDGDRDDQIRALDRLSTVGRIVPDRIPDQAIAEIASVADTADPAVRSHAFVTLAAIGGRPSPALRRHALEFDDVDDVFLGDRPDLVDELVGDQSRPPGVAAFSAVAPHADCIVDALQAEDDSVARAARDAACVLGREAPTWLRSHAEEIWPLVASTSTTAREAGATLLQHAVPGAPPSFLARTFDWLRRLGGDHEETVQLRAMAALGALLDEVMTRESQDGTKQPLDRDHEREQATPSVSTVSGTMFGSYLTGSQAVRGVLADVMGALDVAALPPATTEQALDGLLGRLDRSLTAGGLDDIDSGLDVVRDTSDTEWSVDESAFGDRLAFTAWLTDEVDRGDERLARALVAVLESEAFDVTTVFSTVARGEASLRRASVSVASLLETAYYSPDDYGAEDLRESVLECIPSLSSVDPELAVSILDDLVSDIREGESPYWKRDVAVEAVEAVFLEHPGVARQAQEGLLETVESSDDDQRSLVTRLLATACLVAPPRDRTRSDRMDELLDSPDLDQESETWLAATLSLVAPDAATREDATRRLRSLHVRGDLETFDAVLTVVTATTGCLPQVLYEPLLTTRPAGIAEAVERLPVDHRYRWAEIRHVLRRTAFSSDPPARSALGSLLGTLREGSVVPDPSIVDWGPVLRFGTATTQQLTLQWLREATSGTADASSAAGPPEESASALAALGTHPDPDIRQAAGEVQRADSLGEDDSSRAFPSLFRRRHIVDLGRSIGPQPSAEVEDLDGGVLSPEECRAGAVRFATGEPTDGPEAVRDQVTEALIRTVRHGDPRSTVAGLQAIDRALEHGVIAWSTVEAPVTDHVTDRLRIVRRAAARTVLTATRAGVADPNPGFVADRLVTDRATRGLFTQVLDALDPDRWPAPSRTAPVLVDVLLEGRSYSERHAAGTVLRGVLDEAPDSVRGTITDGVERLADGDGDALAAYHLLEALDRLVVAHHHLADEHTGYLETVLTDESLGGVPERTAGGCLGPGAGETARPVSREAVWRVAARVAAHGGLRAYRGVLNPPDAVRQDEVLTASGVASFLRNAADQALEEIGPRLLEALSEAERASLLETWVDEEDVHSPALAARRLTVVPMLARSHASEGGRSTTARPAYVDAVVDGLVSDQAEVRVAAVEALSALTALGDCPADELVAHLLGRADDPSGWVRRGAVEALADHANEGHVTADRVHAWADQELSRPHRLQARTAAMLLGDLGTHEPSVRRQCLESAASAFPTGRQQLDTRLLAAIEQLVEQSPVLEEYLDATVRDRLEESNHQAWLAGLRED